MWDFCYLLIYKVIYEKKTLKKKHEKKNHKIIFFWQLGYKNQENVTKQPLTLEKALDIVINVFISAAEMDIHTDTTSKYNKQILLLLQLGYKNQENVPKQPLTLEKALAIVKDVFISAAERDIHTGDAIAMTIITKDGVKKESFPLRRD